MSWRATFSEGGSGSGGSFQPITAILLSSCTLALHARQLDVRLQLDYVSASQLVVCIGEQRGCILKDESLENRLSCQFQAEGNIVFQTVQSWGGSGSGGSFQPITAILLSSCTLALHARQLDVRLQLDYVSASQTPLFPPQHGWLWTLSLCWLRDRKCEQLRAWTAGACDFNE
ncbi:uncharacterized protein [Vicugna pacos]|uniref:Uncharacterized protein n=1 Tax=Vicugna pacos TaxID=30538 RepID=A0ABM5CC59_VICPA